MSTIVSIEQLEAAANAAIDFPGETSVLWQNEQQRPLLRDLTAASKTFPGGKGNVTENVAGEYVSELEGFEYDNSVGFGNPGKMKKAEYPWKLMHCGINVTKHELLQNGISVSPHSKGEPTKLNGRDKMVLAELFEYKIEDMQGGMSKDMDEMLWGDGTADPLLVPGIRSIILDDPTDNVTVGAIDQVLNTWWRNYAALGITTTTPSDGNIANALQVGVRAMRKNSKGMPKHKAYAGSDYLEALEKELRAKGNYTLDGWAKTGSIDMSIADAKFKGVEIEYAPTLDDLGLAKYNYWVDTKVIRLRPIEGEDMQKHSPQPPHNKYVIYRAMTWAGALSARQRNTSGVFSIAQGDSEHN